MLKCKQVAYLASEYLDKNTSGKLTLNIRMHLMLCANCRRFMKHLRITNKLTKSLANTSEDIHAEDILRRIRERMNSEQTQ